MKTATDKMTTVSSQSDLIQTLSQQIRKIECSRFRYGRKSESLSIPADSDPLAPLLLPHGNLSGTVIEWLSEMAGDGAMTLAFLVARRAMESGGALVVVDWQRDFYPPAAASVGIDLNRTIVIRPERPHDTLWALEQSLRCPAVAATFCRMSQKVSGPFSSNKQRPCTLAPRKRVLTPFCLRRLQRAAETGRGVGLLCWPAATRHQPAWADIRLLVQPVACESGTYDRCLRVEKLRCRGSWTRQTIELEMCDETGHVRLAPQFPCSADCQSSAGA